MNALSAGAPSRAGNNSKRQPRRWLPGAGAVALGFRMTRHLAQAALIAGRRAVPVPWPWTRSQAEGLLIEMARRTSCRGLKVHRAGPAPHQRYGAG
jgi:hypothetical protein